MQLLNYPHFPKQLSSAHIALFTNVANAASLRARIIAASTMEGPQGDAEREAVNFAFVEAKLVTSLQHIQTAIYQSILSAAQGTLLTKTVHSEIIWYLNPTNNITEALRRFGVSDQCKSLFVVRIGPSGVGHSDVEQQMKEVVAGELSPLETLDTVTDWALVSKYYKLNAETAVSSLPKGSVRQKEVMNEIVSSYVAMKSVAS